MVAVGGEVEVQDVCGRGGVVWGRGGWSHGDWTRNSNKQRRRPTSNE